MREVCYKKRWRGEKAISSNNKKKVLVWSVAAGGATGTAVSCGTIDNRNMGGGNQYQILLISQIYLFCSFTKTHT